jgi:Fe-S cluster biogenesis protein NfuA
MQPHDSAQPPETTTDTTTEPVVTEPPTITPPVSDDERAQRLADLNELIELIRPAVQADGGDLVLLSADVESGVVEVQLQGSCSSCAISSTTLQAGVERILKERLDWVSEVYGGVDEDIDFEASMAMGRGGYTPG